MFSSINREGAQASEGESDKRVRIVFSSIFALFLGMCCLVGCCWLFTLLWCLGMPFMPQTQNMVVFVVAEIVFIRYFVSVLSVLLTVLLGKKEDKSFVEIIAGTPDCSNWCWQGGRSLFTWLILWTVMELRRTSALQLAKSLYRLIAPEDVDVGSKRPNVSPLFQESYVLLWGVFLSLQLFLKSEISFVFVALDIYFIVESTTWILYYSVLRRFYEENYSVYHVMEHLPIILFMIPLQAIAFALVCLHGDGCISEWKNLLPVLLGQASEHYIVFSLMGFVYSAIVVSMIVSTFPVERVKVSIPKTYIIGAGAVVKERLLPALRNRIKRYGEDKVGEISVYTKEDGKLICKEKADGEVQVCAYAKGEEPSHGKNEKSKSACEPKPYELNSIYQLINQDAKNVVVWIETPSDTHLYYLELLKSSASFVVVEKPMACSRNDLAVMKEIVASDYRRKIFFLSYYLLEKALVLTFLKRPSKFYIKYLRYFDNDAVATNGADAEAYQKSPTGEKDTDEDKDVEKFYKAYLDLGKLKSIEVNIEEQEDSRPLPNGGQLIETFLHNCLIASLFAGLPNSWKDVETKRDEIGAYATIDLLAKGEFNEDIHLYLRKYSGAKKRQNATLQFENGCIEADFVKRNAIINGKEGLTLKKRYQGLKGRYAVLCDMVYECYFNQLDPSLIDGLYHQVEVLEWLLTTSAFKSS